MDLNFGISETLDTGYFGLRAPFTPLQIVVNYDTSYLKPDLVDAYVSLVRGLAERYYLSVTRYTTSSFLQLEQLSHRGVSAAHLRKSAGSRELAQDPTGSLRTT